MQSSLKWLKDHIEVPPLIAMLWILGGIPLILGGSAISDATFRNYAGLPGWVHPLSIAGLIVSALWWSAGVILSIRLHRRHGWEPLVLAVAGLIVPLYWWLVAYQARVIGEILPK